MARILVVDDQQPIANFVKECLDCFLPRYLKGEECDVVVVASGEEAVKIIEEPDSFFDLVITDNQMPNMQGLDLIAWIKEYYPAIPIILMSGDLEPDEHGASAFLSKPLDVGTLTSTVLNFC